MAKTSKDAYANVAFGTLTMSAANTLTFAQINMGVGLFEGRALLLHQLRYYPTNASLRELVAATDELIMCMCTTNRLSSIVDTSDPAIIDVTRIVSVGVAVERYQTPIIVDFTNLPGGGRLMPANPIWLCGYTAGAVAASVFRVRLDFTFIELGPQDYLELIQSMFPANVI